MEIVESFEKKLSILKRKVISEKEENYKPTLHKMVILILYAYWENFIKKCNENILDNLGKKIEKKHINNIIDSKKIKNIYKTLEIENEKIKNQIIKVADGRNLTEIDIDQFCVIRGNIAHGNFNNSKVNKIHYSKEYVIGYVSLIQNLIYQFSDDIKKTN